MTEPSRDPASPLAHALGKIPSGLYILTVRDAGRATGMLASWVQQAGFDPPMLTVAIASRRYVAEWVASSGRFALSQLPTGAKGLIRHFGRGFEADALAFEGLTLLSDETARGGPVLAESVAYFDVEVAGELTGGDHRIFLGRVIGAGQPTEGVEPFVHIRHSGLHY
jgi:flavin reductase (DIM6/NTAB) family NADH-FMN oxidoreductase RutF